MAKSISVLVTFAHGRLEKLRQIGREEGMHTSKGTLKNATIAMNIIKFVVDLRHDPTIQKIIEKEHMPILNLIKKAMSQYQERKY